MKKVLFLMLFLTITGTAALNAQVAIGDNKAPEGYSLLELVSGGSRALRLPQLTNAQRDALVVSGQTLAEGLIIFNTDTKCIEYWSGSLWISQCAPTSIGLSGGAIAGPGTQLNPGGVPGEITSILPPSGGTAPYTYSWEYCQSGCGNDVNYNPVATLCPSGDATKASYKPCTMNNNALFRRNVTDAEGATAVSNPANVWVNLVAGVVTQPSPVTVNNPVTLNATASSGGWNTPHTHSWQYCINACENDANWYAVTVNTGGYNCANAGTDLNYTSCNLASTVLFRRQDTDGDQTRLSNTVQATVNTAKPKPVSADILTTAPTTAVCEGTAQTITAQYRSGMSPAPVNPKFYLYGNDGSQLDSKTGSPVSFDVNPATAPNTTYYVSMEADNYDENTATDRKQVQIPVTAKVTPTITISASSTSVTTGTEVTFTSTVTNGGTSPTYQWMVDGVNAGSSSTLKYTWTTTGTKTVSLVYSAVYPCTDNPQASSTVTVAVAVPTYSNDAAGCAAMAKASSLRTNLYPYWAYGPNSCWITGTQWTNANIDEYSYHQFTTKGSWDGTWVIWSYKVADYTITDSGKR